jgi:hypothetical protein
MAAGWTYEHMAEEYPGILLIIFARSGCLCRRDDA